MRPTTEVLEVPHLALPLGFSVQDRRKAVHALVRAEDGGSWELGRWRTGELLCDDED